MTKKSVRRNTIFTMVVLANGVAVAQEATSTPAPAEQRPAQRRQEPPQTEFTEELVVTGSRLPRAELTTAAPVTVITRQQLEATGRVTIGDILQQIPEQSNAINTQFNNGGDGSTRINLRGLGAVRTLVLVNGRRHVAGGTGANASVDLNSIPVAAIQRIEVLKDGGSAIYGSDAISGVVNIITRKDFSGTDLSMQSGVSQRGDGFLYDMSMTTGQVTERGNILFSATYYNQAETWAGDRDFSRYDLDYIWGSRQVVTLGSSAIPEGRVFVAPSSPGNDAWQSLRAQYPTASSFINDNGTWRPYNAIGVKDAGGDQYNYQPFNYLVTPQQRAHVFAAGGLKLNDSTRGFFEGSYTSRSSSQRLAPEPLFTAQEGLVVSADNPYNPFGRDFRDVRRRLEEFGNRIFEQEVNTFRVVAGLEGDISGADATFKNWSWDASFNLGRTQGIEFKQGLLQRSKLAAAVGPGFIDLQGIARCGEDDVAIEGCVPLNLFGGPNTITRDMANYLTYRGTARGFTEQISVQANTRGELFQLPSSTRAIGLAVGYEHRREAGGLIPDPLTATGDTTGNKAAPTEGRYYVNEGYLELSLPVFGIAGEDGAPGREIVELSGATRVFNYNNFGTDLMYKFGGRVTPVKDVTVRGTFSTAFRAPAIAELYLGASDGFPAVRDPCAAPQGQTMREQGTPADAQCDAQGIPDDLQDDRSQIRTVTGGNPNLTPEKATTFTVGMVFEPQNFKDFSATVDYYAINVTEAITSLSAEVILSGCYPTDGSKAPEYCDRLVRDPLSQQIQTIFDQNTNVGGNDTSGVDISLRYFPNTPYGRISTTLDLSWLHGFNATLPGGRVIRGLNNYDLGVYVDWRARLAVGWAKEGFNVNANARWLNGYQECEANNCQPPENADDPPRISRRVESWYAIDANAGYSWKTDYGESSVQLGVNNVLDRAPVRVFNGFLATSDAANYDFMGRYFYARLTHRFF